MRRRDAAGLGRPWPLSEKAAVTADIIFRLFLTRLGHASEEMMQRNKVSATCRVHSKFDRRHTRSSLPPVERARASINGSTTESTSP
jgi:hypothetical protein